MRQRINFILIIALFFIFTFPVNMFGSVFQNFDNIPATEKDQLPASGGDWLYTTATINPNDKYPMTSYDLAGWRKITAYSGIESKIYNYFRLYFNTYNSAHMGFETYGYLEIDSKNSVRGNSLRYLITGGKNTSTLPGSNGLKITKKQQYIDYLNNDQSPIEGSIAVGHPYIYFANTSLNDNPVAFPEAQGNNRLGIYIYAPETLSIGSGGSQNPPNTTIHIGPYNKIGGHWYNQYCVQGGGWLHLIVDGHPQHNNAWNNASLYPYPSYSLRDMNYEYFSSMYRFYITFKPYEGIAIPPYSVWVDEIEFINDTEPQNNETICSPAILYKPEIKTFEVSFMDKYKNNQYSHSTYEIRYSFSPITNNNWSSTKPARIIEDSRFSLDNRTDGRFQKWWPYYQAVWAPFKLGSSEDENKLIPGTKVFFAIKDVSQVDGNSPTPVSPINPGRKSGGRDYQNHGDAFDYAGDKAVLNLIKRIDYYIADEGSIPTTKTPSEPQKLQIIE